MCRARDTPCWWSRHGSNWPTRGARGSTCLRAQWCLARYAPGRSARGRLRPCAYPVQRALTAAMRDAAAKLRDVHRMQAWAGQAAALARAEPAREVVLRLWQDAEALL